MDVYEQIEQLGRLKTDELRERYREVFGEQTATAHKQQLVRRIAWRLQANAEGDLSERARSRAHMIADERDLRVTVPARLINRMGPIHKVGRVVGPGNDPVLADPRRPVPGSVLSRMYRDGTVEVKVLAEGFEYQGQCYGSLSAVARAATGTRWNGLVFFGLAKRGGTARQENRNAGQ